MGFSVVRWAERVVLSVASAGRASVAEPVRGLGRASGEVSGAVPFGQPSRDLARLREENGHPRPPCTLSGLWDRRPDTFCSSLATLPLLA